MSSPIPKKPWNMPARPVHLVGTPAAASLAAVRLALVAERVELGGDDERGRQAGEIAATDTGERVRVVAVGVVAQVLAPGTTPCASVVRKYPVAFSVLDGWSSRPRGPSVTG